MSPLECPQDSPEGLQNLKCGAHPGPIPINETNPPAPPLRRGVKAVRFLRYPFGIPPLNLPHGSPKRLLGGGPLFLRPKIVPKIACKRETIVQTRVLAPKMITKMACKRETVVQNRVLAPKMITKMG